MRYQLRYIRAPQTTSSPVAKHDDSRLQRSRTNLLMFVRAPRILGETAARASLRRRSPVGIGPVAQWESVRFTRGRSLVRSQPGPPSDLRERGFYLLLMCWCVRSCPLELAASGAPSRSRFVATVSSS